jgi:hypothetical protein
MVADENQQQLIAMSDTSATEMLPTEETPLIEAQLVDDVVPVEDIDIIEWDTSLLSEVSIQHRFLSYNCETFISSGLP